MLTIQSWILFSLAAMAAEVGKVLIVKHLCQKINSRIVVLSGRVTSAAVLIPILFIQGIGFPTDIIFWAVIAVTSLITAVAAVWTTDAVKFGNLTVVMPMQATAPVFSQLFLWAVLHELPQKTETLILMLLSMAAVGFTLYAANKDKASGGKAIYTLLSLAAAVLIGISTILDRTAISRVAQGAIAYSACWNLFSAILMAAEIARSRTWKTLQWESWKPLGIYSALSLAMFLSQQLAIQNSLTIPGAVVNVKAITMIRLPILVIIGIVLFGERPKRLTLAASLTAISLAFLLVRSLL
jgi:drug/metabolite transporter (DMT)-like permease